MSWDKLGEIVKERAAELERDQIEKPHVCPHDGEPLIEREDGTLFCRFDGVVHLFELGL